MPPELIQQSWAKWEKGDIPAVLSVLADDVEWTIAGPPDILPFSGTRHGPEQVAQSLAQLGEAMESAQIEPREFVAQDDRGILLGHSRYRVRRTGRSYEEEFAVAYTLHEGKVTKFQSYGDTAAAIRSFTTP
jgi:ketosteroid isomerase-like protein